MQSVRHRADAASELVSTQVAVGGMHDNLSPPPSITSIDLIYQAEKCPCIRCADNLAQAFHCEEVYVAEWYVAEWPLHIGTPG